MTREEAIRCIKAWNLDVDDMEILSEVIPELKESEDERIRKNLIRMIQNVRNDSTEEGYYDIPFDKYIAWLEKQKENPKSADSISSDCVSDAKCENRWHKVGDSLPDSTREVICKDAIGNFFIGRYYKGSNSWEVSMYDDVDKSNEDNPPVVMWCDIPSEKQKEPKNVSASTMIPSCWEEEQKDNKFAPRVLPCSAAWFEDGEEKQKEQKPEESISHPTVQDKGFYKICPRCGERMVRDDSKVYTSMPPQYGYECPKCGEIEFDTTMYDNPEMEEQKPAEKSEYERIRKAIVTLIKDLQHYSTNYAGVDPTDMLAWLENHNPSFKQISDSIKWDSGLRTGIELGKKQKEQKPSISIDQLKSLMLQYLQEAANEKDDSAIEADTDKWARMILRYDFEQKSAEWNGEDYHWEGLVRFLRNYQKTIDRSSNNMAYESVECYIEWIKSLRQSQKQEWSDDIIRRGIKEVGLTQYQIDWLKSNVFPPKEEQKPAEWSEEDELTIADLINYFEGDTLKCSTEEMVQRIKSLRPQSKQEWSEEAEDALNMCLDAIPKKWKTKSGILLTKWLKDNIHLKQEWSEEDERMLSRCIKSVKCSKQFADSETYKAAKDVEMNWLKSLPERFNLQPKQEWSEEDEHRCKDAIYFLETAKKHYASTSEIELTIEWLKSLQPQARQEQKEQTTLEYLPKEKINDIISKLTNLSFRKLIPYNSKEYKKIKEIRTNVRDLLDYPIEQKPAEWSEEDEEKRDDIVKIIEYSTTIPAYGKTGILKLSKEYKKELTDWLKSLRPSWKPSEEQMQALSETIVFAPDTFKPKHRNLNKCKCCRYGWWR